MKVKPNTYACEGGQSISGSCSGANSNLLKAELTVMKNELRVWLIRSLMKKGLATRDIFSFTSKQAELRTFKKHPDNLTSRQAMKAKLGDLISTLKVNYCNRKRRRKELLTELGNKHYSMNKKMKNIRNTVMKERDNIRKKYIDKIAHYQKKQAPNLEHGTSQEPKVVLTSTPPSLAEYSSLSIFGDPKKMKQPVKPLGPYVCSSSIKLNKSEKALLSRDPKYSLCTEVDEFDFMVELERMLTKNRYNDGKNEKPDENKIKTTEPFQKQSCDLKSIFNISEPEKLHIKETERLEKIHKLFEENRKRKIFDPFQKNINLNYRRVTDYKMNKSVNLPGPLPNDREFEGEMRRRIFIKTYKGYMDDVIKEKERKKRKFMKKNPKFDITNKETIGGDEIKNKDMKKMKKKKKQILNLPHGEKLALDSLKKRIKSGEIIISQTDKSSRFAVLTYKQYIQSGEVHTRKDEKITWKDVKYLQGQVNSHVWWISHILGNALKTDQKRMLRNIQPTTMEIPEMVLLFKDHKGWSETSGKPVPSRPVVSGSRGINSHLSELLAEVMEPLTVNGIGVEITSTEEALCKVTEVNNLVQSGADMTNIDVLEKIANGSVSRNRHTIYNSAADVGYQTQLGNGRTTCTTRSDICPEIYETKIDNNFQISGKRETAPEDDLSEEDLETVDLLTELALARKREEEKIHKNNVDGKKSDVMVELKSAPETKSDSEDLSGTLLKKTKIDEYFPKKSGENKGFDFSTNLEPLNTEFWEEKREKALRKSAKLRPIFNEKIRDLCEAGKLWEQMENRRFKMMTSQGEKLNLEKVQDFSKQPILVGGDVVALYPSMDVTATAQLSAQAVLESDILVTGVNFKLLAIYLFLVLGPVTMIDIGLSNCIPTRLWKSDAKALSGAMNRDMNNWQLDIDSVTYLEKKKMIAQMIKIGNLVTMESTCYSFGGEIYRQTTGAGIGLRSSACLAKVTMGLCDVKWAKIQAMWSFQAMMFVRYVDDLRIFCYPIKRGWRWTEQGWKFDLHYKDVRDEETRTQEEVCKSLNSLMNFLSFTAETQKDFSNKMLPTLDVQIRVEENGKLFFKHFSKPTNNNITIQRGTALSQEIIFSSLRQELIRRLKNTCMEASSNERVSIVEDFIQIMINSGHMFSYIKAIVLQALTKYTYLVERSKLNPSNERFLPLYREQEFRREERIMLKYIEPMVWFQDTQLKDPFKGHWKYRIRKRPKTRMEARLRAGCELSTLNAQRKSNHSGKMRGGESVQRSELNVTTTLFVPATPKSELLERIIRADQGVGRDISWKIKFMERSGTPLLNTFMKKFPLSQGCPRGEDCGVCENDTVKCSPKGVVYLASCVKCGENGSNTEEKISTGLNHCVDQKNKHQYVGETSRPIRERVAEHKENLLKWKKESFWLEHWLESHGTEVVHPQFKFEVLASYKDPLRRQLAEGIFILDRGELNRRQEFNNNEICRMVPSDNQREKEKKIKSEQVEKKNYEDKFVNFVAVMSGIQIDLKNVPSNKFNHSRLKRHLKEDLCVRDSKKAKMFHPGSSTSTPIAPRKVPSLIESDSSESHRSINSSIETEQYSPIMAKKTNVSSQMEQTRITPIKPESRSLTEKRLFTTTRNWEDAAGRRGIVRKCNSMPDSLDKLRENALYRSFERIRSRSVDSFFLDSCSWSIEKLENEKDLNGVAGENMYICPLGEQNNICPPAGRMNEEKLSCAVTRGVSSEVSSSGINLMIKCDEENKLSASPEEVVTYGIKAREVITDATVGGSNWKSLPDEENYNRTPKRSLKISPDTQIGLDAKLNRIRLDQTASPTLRGVISQGSPRGRALTLDTPDRISNKLARKLVLGKRRLQSDSSIYIMFLLTTKAES